MNLREYFNTNVRVTFTDGEVLTGFVETYTPAIDSEENVEEIALTNTSDSLIGIMETEIEKIEVVN